MYLSLGGRVDGGRNAGKRTAVRSRKTSTNGIVMAFR